MNIPDQWKVDLRRVGKETKIAISFPYLSGWIDQVKMRKFKTLHLSSVCKAFLLNVAKMLILN